jgi:hypothetical protein
MPDERKGVDAGGGKVRPERYPRADRTDAVEPRSFEPSTDAPTPGQGDDATPDARGEGRLGPGGDPAEGKP